MTERERLAQLTDRWRARRERRRPPERPAAAADREDHAARAFPFRDLSAAEYVERHGAAMAGFTFDEERYADPALDAWLVEVGRLLRDRRRQGR